MTLSVLSFSIYITHSLSLLYLSVLFDVFSPVNSRIILYRNSRSYACLAAYTYTLQSQHTQTSTTPHSPTILDRGAPIYIHYADIYARSHGTMTCMFPPTQSFPHQNESTLQFCCHVWLYYKLLSLMHPMQVLYFNYNLSLKGLSFINTWSVDCVYVWLCVCVCARTRAHTSYLQHGLSVQPLGEHSLVHLVVVFTHALEMGYCMLCVSYKYTRLCARVLSCNTALIPLSILYHPVYPVRLTADDKQSQQLSMTFQGIYNFW